MKSRVRRKFWPKVSHPLRHTHNLGTAFGYEKENENIQLDPDQKRTKLEINVRSNKGQRVEAVQSAPNRPCGTESRLNGEGDNAYAMNCAHCGSADLGKDAEVGSLFLFPPASSPQDELTLQAAPPLKTLATKNLTMPAVLLPSSPQPLPPPPQPPAPSSLTTTPQPPSPSTPAVAAASPTAITAITATAVTMRPGTELNGHTIHPDDMFEVEEPDRMDMFEVVSSEVTTREPTPAEVFNRSAAEDGVVVLSLSSSLEVSPIASPEMHHISEDHPMVGTQDLKGQMKHFYRLSSNGTPRDSPTLDPTTVAESATNEEVHSPDVDLDVSHEVIEIGLFVPPLRPAAETLPLPPAPSPAPTLAPAWQQGKQRQRSTDKDQTHSRDHDLDRDHAYDNDHAREHNHDVMDMFNAVPSAGATPEGRVVPARDRMDIFASVPAPALEPALAIQSTTIADDPAPPGKSKVWQANFALCNTCGQLVPLFMVETHR